MQRKTKPFWQIEMTAENMLNHCGCFDCPYKYIDFMIESCGIDIIPLDIKNENLLGIFGKDKNNVKFIGFNKNLIPARILFTKAHELGHFVLEHELSGELLTDSVFETKNPQETEANAFAAALLMPKANVIKVIKSSLNKLSIKIESQFEYDNLTVYQKNVIIDDMKDFFHTSKQSIEFRIKNTKNT